MINAISTIGVCAISSPRFMLIIPIAIFVCARIQRFCEVGLREVARIETSIRAPLYTHFGQTLKGCQTIRAFPGSVQRFIAECHKLVENSNRSIWADQTVRQWLSVRMELMIAAPLVGFSALLAVLTPAGIMGVAAAGLTMQYSARIQAEITNMMESYTYIAANGTRIERVWQYIDLPPEETIEQAASKVHADDNWPSRGKITLRDVTLTYRPGLAPALKEISCDIQAGEKIGVVGRTGAMR